MQPFEREFVFIGEMDSHMLSMLQSKFPATPIKAHIVEPSIALIENFKGNTLCHSFHHCLTLMTLVEKWNCSLSKLWNSAEDTEIPRTFLFSLTASVAKASNLQKIPFTWNAVSCAEYEKLIKDTKSTTRFDFINMIQVQLFYYHSWFVHHAPNIKYAFCHWQVVNGMLIYDSS